MDIGHALPGLDRAAVGLDVGDERIGDRLRAALGHQPTSRVPGDDQHQPDRAGEGPVEPVVDVGRHPGPERLGRIGAERPRQRRGRQRRGCPEAGQQERVVRDPHDGLADIGQHVVEVLAQPTEHLPPPIPVVAQRLDGAFDRPVEHTG